jgi:hypothetical protein
MSLESVRAMGLEYYVTVDLGNNLKNGFLSTHQDYDVLTGLLAKPSYGKIIADIGEHRGKNYLHLAEIRQDGKVALFWLEQSRDCRHSGESVYSGPFNVENIPMLCEKNFKSILMDAPRYKNGRAVVHLTVIDPSS